MGCFGLSLIVFVILWVIWFSAVIGCSTESYAIYRLRFEGLWTKERFPKVYPESRPRAEWSPLIGRTHSDRYRLFELSSLMSDKLKSFVELGETSGLASEGQGHELIFDTFSTPALISGHGITEATVIASNKQNKMSVAVKIVPSPDWFVGVDSLPLCENGKWVESYESDLWPLDGGTQRGYTFTSPRWRSDPVEEITQITSLYPNHTADAFYYPQSESLPPIASISLRLSKVLAVTDENLNREYQRVESSSYKPQFSFVRSHQNRILKPPIPSLIKTDTGAFMRAVFAMRSTPSTTTQRRTTPTTTTTLPTAETYQATAQRFTRPRYPSRTPTTARPTAELATNSTRVMSASSPTPSVGNSDGQSSPKMVEYSTTLSSPNSRPSPTVRPSPSTVTIDQTTSGLTTIPVVQYIRQIYTNVTRYLTTTESVVTESERGRATPARPVGLVDDEDSVPGQDDYEIGSGWGNTGDPEISQPDLPLVSNTILPVDDEDDTTDDDVYYSKECLVSEWSPWGECSKTCGYGVKVRTRRIIRWTGNVVCPELRMEQLCGSMKQCNWNHFSLTFNSTKSILAPKPRRRPKPRLERIGQTAALMERQTGRRGKLRGKQH